jgi:hypothetical protein
MKAREARHKARRLSAASCRYASALRVSLQIRLATMLAVSAPPNATVILIRADLGIREGRPVGGVSNEA